MCSSDLTDGSSFFMKESPLIVPIQLETDSTKKRTPICCVQLNGSEITFYPGINDDLLRRVLTELMKNVS